MNAPLAEDQRLESLEKPDRLCVESLFQSLPSPIAFIGNGKINKEYGNLIDSHNTIIRCNNFQLDGFEKFAGTRTTHWCVHGKVDRVPFMRPAKRWLYEKFDRWRLIGIKPNKHIAPGTPIFMPKAFELLAVNGFKKHFHTDLICVKDASLIYPIQKEIPLATTGFMAMYLLVQFVPQVSVFGFSGMQGGHYYNAAHKHNPRHLPNALRELLLIKNSQRVQFYE